jgi:phospholipid/cholesterol/gamma-HCH transport system substrate-binding protein
MTGEDGVGGHEIQQDGGRGLRDQIERYRTAFIAVVTMVVIAAASAGYILAHERLSLPGWVPIVGREYFTLNGEFETAQAVTPGQGQSVTIAGAKVGEIASVQLRNSRALVTMHLTPRYARYIYRDATMLLRPKTQLKDETIEVNPGTPAAGRVPGGYTLPISQTAPDANLDELLASLDGDTRAYLQELVNGAGEGLRGNAANLSATFKRFAPLGRDLQEIGREVAKRQANVARGIHNFRLLLEALGDKDKQLAELVDSSNAVFATFSQQDRQFQETLRELPGALRQTNEGLGKFATAASVLGPTLHQLEPFANALAPAERASRPFFKQTTPILKNQIRPFLRQAAPFFNQVQPSIDDFAQALPQLTTSFTVLNELFNELAYNPGPNQGGFLFFAGWGAHNLNSVVAQGDAHGAFGQVLTYFNCNQVPIIKAAATVNPAVNLIVGLLDLPGPALCNPTALAAGSAAKAASLHGPVNPMAQLADRVFGQGPDAFGPAGTLGGGG